MSIKINGGKALADALRNASKDVQQEASDAVFDFGTDLHQDISDSIQYGSRTGVVYEKYTPRRTHQASAPLEAPKSDQGGLVGSIYLHERGKFSVAVGTKLKYAKALEYGTRDEKIQPRPFFRPAFERGKAEFRRTMERIIGSALK